MATIKCPICGTINPNGRRRLARCRRCREDLAGCRYCAYYDPKMMDCAHPSRPDWLRIVDARESLNCEDFTSILVRGAGAIAAVARETPFRPVRLLRTGAIAAVIGLAVALGGLHLYRATTRTGPSVPLRVTVSAPAEASADTGFVVTVLVQNQGEHPAEEVQVIIGGKSMRNFICQSVEPPEAFAQATARTASARLGRIEPGDIQSVTFRFSPKRPGDVKLLAQVTAGNAEAPESIPIEGEILP